MHPISVELKGLLNASVRLLNRSIIKEGVKNVAGSVTFVFGILEVYDIYQITRGREISTKAYSKYSKWTQIANKTIVVCAKISLILSAGVSRTGVFIVSSILGRIFSAVQLERAFGPNTIFAVNPWHPRHVMSVVAVIFALSSVAQSIYIGINWMYMKISHHQIMPTQNTQNWPTDFKIRLMTLFNIMTSRPALHIGNQISRIVLGKV